MSTDETPEVRPILIGEAPSKRGDRYHIFPLSGPPARVLCTLAGIPPEEGGSTYGRWTWALYDRFECRNLFERYAEAEPWSVVRARDAAERLDHDLRDRIVVALGRRVQAALAIPGDFHQWETRRRTGMTVGRPFNDTIQLVAVPHPSGLNRALNDPAERARCGETLRAALEYAVARDAA